MNLLGKAFLKMNTLLFKHKYNVQSFTYYIPAPPMRKTGYREKEFDNIFYKIMGLGFKIIDFKTIAHSSETQSGFWVCFILRPINKKAASLKSFDIDEIQDLDKSHNLQTEDLEIYYDNQDNNLTHTDLK